MHGRPLRALTALCLATVLGGCSASEPERACNLVGAAPPRVDISPALAERVTDVALRLCRDGWCHEPRVRLTPARSGGGRTAEIQDARLTAQALDVTVRLTTSSGTPPVAAHLEVVPRTIRRGHNCGVTYDMRLRVADDGSVTQS